MTHIDYRDYPYMWESVELHPLVKEMRRRDRRRRLTKFWVVGLAAAVLSPITGVLIVSAGYILTPTDWKTSKLYKGRP